jgi:hypothetical protein
MVEAMKRAHRSFWGPINGNNCQRLLRFGFIRPNRVTKTLAVLRLGSSPGLDIRNVVLFGNAVFLLFRPSNNANRVYHGPAK